MNKFIEHTADVAVVVKGQTLQDLFKNSLKAMDNILKKGHCATVTHSDCCMRVVISSSDRTNLLIDFLSEVLALTNIQKTLFCDVYFSELTEKKVDAQLYGIWFDQFDVEIKGVTYHEAKVVLNQENLWETHIIFDI